MTIMSDIISFSSSSSLSQNTTGYSYSAAEAAVAASVASASLPDDVKDCPYAYEVIYLSSSSHLSQSL